jgi:hypothetical protein
MTWEDEDGNRNIQFSIGYEIENSEVHITKVTPTEVAFLCSESKEVTRKIGVHTEAGQTLLANQFLNAERTQQIKTAIATEAGLLISA